MRTYKLYGSRNHMTGRVFMLQKPVNEMSCQNNIATKYFPEKWSKYKFGTLSSSLIGTPRP